MQKTNFDFEILINDDASNDGTVEILKRYQHKFPDKIFLNIQKENQYSKGIRNMIPRYLLPKAKGKYLAICEGDDYWTDPNKLQKQVDFLENNLDYALCFHPVKVKFEKKEHPDSIFPDTSKGYNFDVKALLKANFIQTNSVMYRRQNYKNLVTDVMPGDWYLHLFHAQFGKIGFIDQIMSVYRRHDGGIWWQTSKGGDVDEIWKKHGVGHLVLYSELLKIYGNNEHYRRIIDEYIYSTVRTLIRLDSSKNTNLIELYIQRNRDNCEDVFISLCRTIVETAEVQERRISDLQLENSDIKLENNNTKLENSKLQLENDKILNSLSWKITQPLRKLNKIIRR